MTVELIQLRGDAPRARDSVLATEEHFRQARAKEDARKLARDADTSSRNGHE